MYRFLRFEIILIITSLLPFTVITNAACAFQKEQNDAVNMDQLATQLEHLQGTLGKDHPKVVAVRKQMEVMSRFRSDLKVLPEHQAVLDRLTPMFVEEQLLLSKFGKDHPKVKEVRSRIEFTTKYLTDKLRKSAKRAGAGNPHTAFLKLLPLLLREQQLTAKYGAEDSNVAAVRKQIIAARKALAAATPATVKQAIIEHSPGVNDDIGKPARYSIQSNASRTVLMDGLTGQIWISKIVAGETQWIPVKP